MIPDGWMFKTESTKGHKSSKEYLTKDATLLKSYKLAMEYFQNEDVVTKEEIASFQEFAADESKKYRQQFYDWLDDDPTLPEGWKYKKSSGSTSKTFFLSPDGDKQFPSRRLALIYMIERGYSEEDKDRMIEAMKSDGWERNEYLPPGWIIKVKTREIITSEGELLKSFKGALDLMDRSELYSDYDALKFGQLVEELGGERRQEQNDWDQNANLPRGWRLRKTGAGKTFFLSPDGKQFNGDRITLQHIIENGYPDEDVETMREAMTENGWQRTEHLPADWLYRETASNGTTGISKSIKILSSCGKLFESYVLAKEFMKVEDEYTEEDIEKLAMLADQNSRARRRNLYQDWYQDDSLPEGWSVRTPEGSHKKFFLAPDFSMHSGRRSAILHMFKMEASLEDIDIMRDAMAEDGWERSDLLPGDWLFKRDSKGSKNSQMYGISILTDTMERLGSYLAAIRLMENDDKYSQEDIDNVNKLLTENIPNSNSEIKSTSSLAPPGWKVISLGKHRYMVSPKDEQFKCKRNAYQHMAKDGYSEDDLMVMRRSLVEDGWSISEFLPENWLFKFGRNGKSTSIHILNSEGERFSSYLAVIKMMENSGKRYDEEDIKKINKLIDLNSRKARLGSLQNLDEEDVSESNHPLPEGWKERTCGKQVFVVSPEGLQLGNKRKALQFLIQNKYPERDVQIMRLAMENEGWKPSEYLPENWKTKQRTEKGSLRTQFLSDQGDLIDSFLAAMKALEVGGYPQKYIEKVSQLLEDTAKSSRLSIINEASSKYPTPPGWKIRVCGKHR